MSLADLKNNKSKSQVKTLSIDDFIDDAVAYSQGKSTLGRQGMAPPKKRKKTNRSSRCKRATFSLSDQCIVQLNELAQKTGINKSRLIRMMVDQTKSKDSQFLDDKKLTECKIK